MGRKEQCPQCRSGRITVLVDSKKCNVCGYEWAGKVRRKTSKKDKVRF
jgi:uncharacterized protein (DUF983 family)